MQLYNNIFFFATRFCFIFLKTCAPSFISEEGIDEHHELLRRLNALDLLEVFHQEGINVSDFNDLDNNDFVDMGISVDRAKKLHSGCQKENDRKKYLHQALKGAECVEVYEHLVKAGYASEDLCSLTHDDLKETGLSFMQRKTILKKIQSWEGNLPPCSALIIIQELIL